MIFTAFPPAGEFEVARSTCRVGIGHYAATMDARPCADERKVNKATDVRSAALAESILCPARDLPHQEWVTVRKLSVVWAYLAYWTSTS
jgi:hypothetical protein